MTLHNDNGANIALVGGAVEIDASVSGKFSHGDSVFFNADSIQLNSGNHGITVNSASSIGSITTTSTSVPAVTLTITPGHTVNLGGVGAPTDLSNGAIAFFRINQPTLVTDGQGMSFVVTQNDVPATITVSALGDAAHTDSSASITASEDSVAYTAAVAASSNSSHNPYLGMDGDFESFLTAVMGDNAPNDPDANGG